MGNPLLEFQDYIIDHGVQTGLSYPLAWVSINGSYIWRAYRHDYGDACDVARVQVSIANWLLGQLSDQELADEEYVIREMTMELEDALV